MEWAWNGEQRGEAGQEAEQEEGWRTGPLFGLHPTAKAREPGLRWLQPAGTRIQVPETPSSKTWQKFKGVQQQKLTTAYSNSQDFWQFGQHQFLQIH